jgi:surface protein
MTNVFYGATNFNSEVASWNTSSVTTMSGMFANATHFNQPLKTAGSAWDVSKVTSMAGMFANAINFDQALDSRQPLGIIAGGLVNFLTEAKLSTEHYNALLMSRSAQPLLTNLVFAGGRSQWGGCVANSEGGAAARVALMTAVGEIPPSPLYERGL